MGDFWGGDLGLRWCCVGVEWGMKKLLFFLVLGAGMLNFGSLSWADDLEGLRVEAEMDASIVAAMQAYPELDDVPETRLAMVIRMECEFMVHIDQRVKAGNREDLKNPDYAARYAESMHPRYAERLAHRIARALGVEPVAESVEHRDLRRAMAKEAEAAFEASAEGRQYQESLKAALASGADVEPVKRARQRRLDEVLTDSLIAADAQWAKAKAAAAVSANATAAAGERVNPVQRAWEAQRWEDWRGAAIGRRGLIGPMVGKEVKRDK